ncbi:MAG: nucleoside triphosphate pyrophosphohydrolase [Clostridiales bacterium]|nr:nucleoside triphosphate pyrophosphohydrolase [Clostridiales bacterium]MDO4350697.1 nucleoside triphosphate pyrophosphohydrolase [Eubacteriales bacterium]MDY4008008.1 nucleoside triphosphate pyrophosphohydrolase [Candidatus Limiplasma sp.]
MNRLTIVTLGTGGDMFLTRGVERALKQAERVVLRTRRHPMAEVLRAEGVAFETLDALYDECGDFDTFNRAAAVHLLALCDKEPVCYAVSDAAFDMTVSTLQRLKPRDASVVVLPGVSHADRCLAMVEGAPASVRLYAAAEFEAARVSPGEALLLMELHSRECAGDCKLKLMELLPDETDVVFFTGDEQTGELGSLCIPLYELDRQPVYDHLTAAYVPAVPMARRARYDMDDLIAVMKRLRAPDGCPWDREQTYESLLPSLLEESYEYIQAVREGDIDHMYDELGDVLLQVVFHAEIARQHGDFDILDVTSAICQKMIERHTHIFGAERAETSEEVLDNWEALKRRQRGIATHAQAMENVSTGLSPLLRAVKVQSKAHKAGFDYPDAAGALSKVYEEADEVAQCLHDDRDAEEELGDLLFSAASVCRLLGKDPDIALYSAVNKFISRFRNMENEINKSEKCFEHLTLSEMDVYWNAGKQGEKRV